MILEKIKENKKKFVALIIVLIIAFLYTFTSWVPRFQSTTEYLWAINLDNDKELVGAHENVFIAEVLKKKGQEKKRDWMHTIFEVEVLENIKGKLKGKIDVFQEGGYKGAFFEKPDRAGFLKEGKKYLLFTRENYILGHPRGHQEVIKNSEKYSKKEILNKKEVKKLIERYQEAYKNEIYDVSDIMDNNLKNSYRKFTNEERRQWIKEYYKKKKEDSRKSFIDEYKKKGFKVTEKEIDKLVELNFAGIDMRIFNSFNEAKEWDKNHKYDDSSAWELNKLEKEIENRNMKSIEKK